MEQQIKNDFGRIWPAHVGNLTRFLASCRRSFDGDFDMFLILAVIGDCTYSQQHADPNDDYAAFTAGQLHATPPVNINIRSIADYTGIPRETVRRKINLLVEKGWVVRGGNDYLTATRKSAEDLQPLTEASIQYIAQMVRLFRQVMPADAWSAGKPPPKRRA
jgi:hypothetical protein